MRLLIAAILFYFPLLCSIKVSAQPYYFRHYQVESGLSNATVFCSVQDEKGFLWFGTKDGLNRFDGYHFKRFQINTGKHNVLANDFISDLLVDKKGVLWVGSKKGLYWFDAKTECLQSFIDSLKDISDLFIDKEEQLWFISGNSLCRYNFTNKTLRQFPPSQYFNATSICQTADGNMWFSSNDGNLFKYNPAKETFTQHNVFAHSPKATSRLIETIFPQNDSTLLIGTSNQGIKQFFIKASDYTDLLTYNDDKTTIYVRDIIKNSESEIWFATESGIFIWNVGTKQFTNLKKKYLDPYTLSDNAVYTLYKDMEGGIWAGTFFGGVNYYSKQSSTFQKYFPDYSKNSITGNIVREIIKDDKGNLWIGTEDAGLNKANVTTGAITHFTPTGTKGGIAYSNIHGLAVVNNHLWVGTFEHGLDVLDLTTEKVIKHYAAGPGPYDLKNNFIVSLLYTRSGSLLVGSASGLLQYKKDMDGFQTVKEIQEPIFVSCLFEDGNGTIWVGTHNMGIFYYNPATGSKGHFLNLPDNNNSLPTNTINAIYEDSKGHLWFSTEGGGLCRYNTKQQLFTRYTTADFLPSNFVFKVIEDDQQTLWITTSKGLVNYKSNSGESTIYTKENGLLNDQFNYNSGYKDANGKLYFGSVKGMISFNPQNFFKTAFNSRVYLTAFQVHNKELSINKDSSFLKQSILYTKAITLPYNQSSFSIDFAALSFTTPERTEYSYIMEGLDNDWTNIASNRKVYFTNLAPGTYAFKVKAANNGVWSKENRTLTIQILPPFWATSWAYAIYVLTIGLILYYLVSSYHKIQEDKKEKEIYEAKIDFFTNVAHEIRTPLTLIKGPVENLAEMVTEVPQIKEDVATMERNTSRLVNLINQILDFRQTETKSFSLDFAKTNLNEILQEVYVTFEPLAKKRNLKYVLKLPSFDVYTIADAEALLKIFSNLFNNAVKYADKEVSVTMHRPEKEDKLLTIEFQNDGHIIPAEMSDKIFEPFYRLKETSKQKGTGIGLALARSLAELHKGRLFLKLYDKRLNTFVLLLPLKELDKDKSVRFFNEIATLRKK